MLFHSLLLKTRCSSQDWTEVKYGIFSKKNKLCFVQFKLSCSTNTKFEWFSNTILIWKCQLPPIVPVLNNIKILKKSHNNSQLFSPFIGAAFFKKSKTIYILSFQVVNINEGKKQHFVKLDPGQWIVKRVNLKWQNPLNTERI